MKRLHFGLPVALGLAVLLSCSVADAQATATATLSSPTAGQTISGNVNVRAAIASINNNTGLNSPNGTLIITDDASNIYNVALSSTNTTPGVPGYSPYGTNFSAIGTWSALGLIRSPATSYQGTAEVYVSFEYGVLNGQPTNYASSTPINVNVQVGYVLASSNNTVKVTAPAPGSTFHLDNPFSITSDHHFEFTRFDNVGSYTPLVEHSLSTTYPGSAPFPNKPQFDTNENFSLPKQLGACDKDYTSQINQAVTDGVPGFYPITNQAKSYYPPGTQIASDTESATGTIP